MSVSLEELKKLAPPSQSGEQMGGFAKGLAVIEAFGREQAAMTIADVARTAGLDRATARRCLLTLVRAGYAVSDGRRFELTPRVLRLGHAYLAAPLSRLIQPSIDALADIVQESSSASVLDGNEVVFVARTSRHRLMGVGLHRGSRLPAYCTAMGRVLLASLPPDQSRTILAESKRAAVTERTLTGLDDLVAELETVRADGYALIDQELEQGSRSIAVPIRNIDGVTVAAINVAAPAARASLDRFRQEFLPHLRETQLELADILP